MLPEKMSPSSKNSLIQLIGLVTVSHRRVLTVLVQLFKAMCSKKLKEHYLLAGHHGLLLAFKIFLRMSTQ